MKLTKSTLKQLIKEQLETELDVEAEAGASREHFSIEQVTTQQLNMLLEDFPSWLKDHGITTYSMDDRLEVLEALHDQLEDDNAVAAADF